MDDKLFTDIGILTVEKIKELINHTESLEADNTVLLEALMDVCHQYMTDNDGYCRHMFMTTGEWVLPLLERNGLAKHIKGDKYKLLWDKLERREKGNLHNG